MNPTVPAEFNKHVGLMMEKDPTYRYPNMASVRAALLPWAAADPPTPMDVDPDQSAIEVVREIEKAHQSDQGFFESIPVVVFAERGKRAPDPKPPPPEKKKKPATAERKKAPPPPPKEETGEEQEGAGSRPARPRPLIPVWALLIAAAILLVGLGGCLTAVVMYFVKR